MPFYASTRYYNVLEFKNHELKKVNCHYIQEANDILQKLKEQGIRMI